MFSLRVSPEAAADLRSIYVYVANDSGAGRAKAIIDRAEAVFERLRQFPQLGTPRPHVRPLLRIFQIDRTILVAYHLDVECVLIDRVLYRGRDLVRAL